MQKLIPVSAKKTVLGPCSRGRQYKDPCRRNQIKKLPLAPQIKVGPCRAATATNAKHRFFRRPKTMEVQPHNLDVGGEGGLSGSTHKKLLPAFRSCLLQLGHRFFRRHRTPATRVSLLQKQLYIEVYINICMYLNRYLYTFIYIYVYMHTATHQ